MSEFKLTKLEIRKDEFGRFVERNTNFIFNRKKEVIGVKNGDNMRNLFKDEKLFCKQYDIKINEENIMKDIHDENAMND